MKISVAVIALKAPLSVGDKILIKEPTTDFEKVLKSMQIEHKNVQKAEAGQSIGLKIKELDERTWYTKNLWPFSNTNCFVKSVKYVNGEVEAIILPHSSNCSTDVKTPL